MTCINVYKQNVTVKRNLMWRWPRVNEAINVVIKAIIMRHNALLLCGQVIKRIPMPSWCIIFQSIPITRQFFIRYCIINSLWMPNINYKDTHIVSHRKTSPVMNLHLTLRSIVKYLIIQIWLLRVKCTTWIFNTYLQGKLNFNY